MSNRSRMRGFSQVELLISTALVLTLSAASFPTATRNIETYRLRNDSYQIAALLQSTRFLAVSANVPHRVQRNGDILEVQRQTSSGFTVVDQLRLSPGVTIAGYWPGDPVFSPRGTVSPSGTMTLSNRRGMQRTITMTVVGMVREQ